MYFVCLQLIGSGKKDNFVGLSNILDRERNTEFPGRKPVKRTHRPEIGAGVVDSELRGKVGKGEETVGAVEPLLILTVTALNLAVMAGRVGAVELVPDTEAGGGLFKMGGNILF